METVTRDPWLDMTAVAHGYFHRQDFHLLDKRARLAALPPDSCRAGWMPTTEGVGHKETWRPRSAGSNIDQWNTGSSRFSRAKLVIP